MRAQPLNLMQFWDAPHAPPDVEELMASWRTDPQFAYHRYSWESAHAFIRERFDRRTLAVFETCAVPAMQSDVFRLCWLFEEAGVYVDADQGNRGRNESFTDRAARGHLFHGRSRPRPQAGGGTATADTPLPKSQTVAITNNLMSFFDRRDPLVGTLLERVSTNIDRRINEPIWRVSGPGVISGLLIDLGPEHALFDNVRIHAHKVLGYAMRFVRCEYKSSATHWGNVKRPVYRLR